VSASSAPTGGRRFLENAERFMRPGVDRLAALGEVLAGLGLRYSVVRLGGARHVLMQVGKGPPRLALVAHYDRFSEGSGALDNSCACLQLADFAARLSARRAAGEGDDRSSAGSGLAAPKTPTAGGAEPRAKPVSLLIAFTDAEEAPGSGEASSQGSFALARALMAKGAPVPGLSALVFDVTGRGGRLVYSTAPESLLRRNGLESSSVAVGYRSLVDLASRAAEGARLEPPVAAELSWSDDLGLTLGGIPALTLSLLPEAEIPILEARQKPPTWMLLHTDQDSPDKAEPEAFRVVAAFLDSLERHLSSCASP